MNKLIPLLLTLALSASACGQAGAQGVAVPSPVRTSAAVATPHGESTPEPVRAPLEDLVRLDPATVDNSDLEVTSTEELHTTGEPVDIDVDEYQLVVDGLVENPLRLGYEDILSRRSVTEVVLLICPGVFVDNAEWTGTPLAGILEEAGVKPEAKRVEFYGADGYRTSVTIEEAMDPGVLVAYRVNGEVLPREHGYPLRVVAEGKYGSRWAKWLLRIEVK
jgi:DMSO/TMAO reductase YedYZ molybdopterin-dependent catalytic subunit